MSEEKTAVIPARMYMEGSVLESIKFMIGDDAEDVFKHSDAIIWVGNRKDDDGRDVYGLHLCNADYPEEGSITLVEFDPPKDQSLLDKVAAAIHSADADSEGPLSEEDREDYLRMARAALSALGLEVEG